MRLDRRWPSHSLTHPHSLHSLPQGHRDPPPRGLTPAAALTPPHTHVQAGQRALTQDRVRKEFNKETGQAVPVRRRPWPGKAHWQGGGSRPPLLSLCHEAAAAQSPAQSPTSCPEDRRPSPASWGVREGGDAYGGRRAVGEGLGADRCSVPLVAGTSGQDRSCCLCVSVL